LWGLVLRGVLTNSFIERRHPERSEGSLFDFLPTQRIPSISAARRLFF
jgi:hypothetical protein